MGELSRGEVLRLLEGQKRAHERVKKEKKRDFSKREVHHICDLLWEVWQKTPKEGLERLERRKLVHLLERRRRLKRIWRHLQREDEPLI
ncbi:MAG TPA: hypothetical protein ENF44_05830 [Deltaproteobacteria bacterium]|nr:hypothetical protein [Deltaproteobacteria bacterium]